MRTAEQMQTMIGGYATAGIVPASRQSAAAEANRAARITECGEEVLEKHVANRDQALAAVDALEVRLAELDPQRLEGEARADLAAATSAGDATAMQEAAALLQTRLAGVAPSVTERLQVEARLAQARADLASAAASLERAADDALRDRLAMFEKELAKQARAFEGAAQAAYERRETLRNTARTYLEIVAALGRTEPRSNPNYAPLARPSDSVELPPVVVPNLGTVRSRGGEANVQSVAALVAEARRRAGG